LDTISAFFAPYIQYLPLLGWVSVFTFLLSLAIVPALLARIPVNYFKLDAPSRPKISGFHYALLWVLRNLAALILILAGIAMLLLPGQGLLTIVLGIFVADFPGKRNLERRLIANRKVFAAINWIRDKKGVERLAYPDKPAEPSNTS